MRGTNRKTFDDLRERGEHLLTKENETVQTSELKSLEEMIQDLTLGQDEIEQRIESQNQTLLGTREREHLAFAIDGFRLGTWEWHSSKSNRDYALADIPLHNDDGTISKLEVFRDITERKRAEEDLRASEEQHRAIIDASPLAIIAHDGNERVVSMGGASFWRWCY